MLTGAQRAALLLVATEERVYNIDEKNAPEFHALMRSLIDEGLLCFGTVNMKTRLDVMELTSKGYQALYDNAAVLDEMARRALGKMYAVEMNFAKQRADSLFEPWRYAPMQEEGKRLHEVYVRASAEAKALREAHEVLEYTEFGWRRKDR